MKKQKIFAWLLSLSLLAALTPTYASAESTSQIKARLFTLEAEKAQIDEQITELEGQISENYGQMEQIVAQKDLIDQEVFLLHQQITNLGSQISEYSLLIADKQEELEEAEAHLAELQAKNEERIRAIEKNGGISYWSVIFRASSFADLLDRLKMIEEIQAADKARLEEMAQAAEAVAQAKVSLEAEKEALEAGKEELSRSQESLETKRAEADSLLAELVATGEEYEALLEESEAQQSELMQQIANAEADYESAKQQEYQVSQPPASSTGNFNAPSNTTAAPSGSGWIVPCNYTYFSSPFGYRTHPLDGVWRMHYGVDLAGPTSTPIYASRSGTVCTASYQEGGAGFYVQIDHGDGYRSIYMHMTHYVVSCGQYVEQGQLIGYMGSTGGSNGPHLHFGISYNGTYVNPADYINI